MRYARRIARFLLTHLVWKPIDRICTCPICVAVDTRRPKRYTCAGCDPHQRSYHLVNRKDRRSNRGRLRSSRAKYHWRYVPSWCATSLSGARYRIDGFWHYIRIDPYRPGICRRGPALVQLRRLERKRKRREGQHLIRDELEWMSYERLLHQHASRFFEAKVGSPFHQDIETYVSTLSGWELRDIEYERGRQEDMLKLIADLSDEDDEGYSYKEDELHKGDEILDSPQSQWVEGFHNEFEQPDPWDNYPYEDEWEEVFDDYDEEIVHEKKADQLLTSVDLAQHRQNERTAVSLRRYQQGRRN